MIVEQDPVVRLVDMHIRRGDVRLQVVVILLFGGNAGKLGGIQRVRKAQRAARMDLLRPRKVVGIGQPDAVPLGRPLSFFITAGQINDYTDAAALLDDMPKAQWMLADRRYDADWFRDALEQRAIKPCIPGRNRSLLALINES